MELWEIEQWFVNQEEYLQSCYIDSKLPEGPNELKIKKLLIKCIQMYYGHLSKFRFPTI